MKRTKIAAVLLAVVILMSLLPAAVYAEEADLTISTADELIKFAKSVNGGETYKGKTVILENSVDLGGEGSVWAPIGSSSCPFEGIFDGGYHTVGGLYFSDSTASNAGLFGYVNGGCIKNTVVSGVVTGKSAVAGVVGYLNAGTVENCGNNAAVSGQSNIGGVVGTVNGDCAIDRCFNKGDVTGSVGYIGGVTGQHWRAGTVSDCYNEGKVTGPATVGGVVGGHKASSPVVTNCFNAGSVTDSAGNSNNICAVVGASRGTNTNCYYIKGTGTDTKSGIKEVEAVSAKDLGDVFEDSEAHPVLKWEKSIVALGGNKFDEQTELSAKLANYIKAAVKSAKAGSDTDTLLGNEGYLAGASSTATDWMAMAMARFGYMQDGEYVYMIDDGTGYKAYLTAMKAYIEKTYAENSGILHRAKATEWHRAVVTIKALGGDPTDFGVYNGNPIDLIADGSYNSVLRAGPGTQGINGWIWGLIAADTGVHEFPSDAKYPRDRFITEILKMQLTDGVHGNEYGGWVLGGYGTSSDVDITAMALQALAPYYNDDTVYTYTNEISKKIVSKTVRQCVDEALDRLSYMMNENAGFSSWNTDNSESVAQVIVALCSLGIDPAKDTRFITDSGKTLLDGLMRFRLTEGGFCHIIGGGWNSMANDQATYALVAYWRFENGMRALYDMRDAVSEQQSALIKAAVDAITAIGAPTEAGYKTRLKAALVAFRSVDETERRYVYNYGTLADAIETVGGEKALDTDDAYPVGISVTTLPDKTVYTEGEIFDPTGMVVTVNYSDGKSDAVTDYRLSENGKLVLGTDKVYVICGKLKTSFDITVKEKMPWDGEGTENSPYVIKTAEQLVSLAEAVNKGKSFSGCFFVLENDVDLSGVANWTPVGRSAKYVFEGVFDGKSHVVKELNSTVGGLFGYVGNSCIIRNVGVASGVINAPRSSFVGGIAMWSNGADIINCFNGADIFCGGYSGGIVGTVRDGGDSTVKNCCNTGNITTESGAVGGIIGHLDTTRSGYVTVNVTIENCYNTGNIKAQDSVGGIVGRAQDGHRILNCYNSGLITSSDDNSAGGIAGAVTSGNVIENCYYDKNSAAVGVASGNDTVTGKTAEEMASKEFATLLGEAFKCDRYELINGGYPILSWQSTADADNIDSVIAMIDAIGEVSLESENVIISARAAYNALPEEQKTLVGNYSTLTDAEARLEAIKADIPATGDAGIIPLAVLALICLGIAMYIAKRSKASV